MEIGLPGRKADYKSPNGNIAFYNNDADASDAYDVIIRKRDHLYIHTRTLPDLTDPQGTVNDMMDCLEAMSNGMASQVLRTNEISPEEFQIALLHLRVMRTERELHHALEELVKEKEDGLQLDTE